MNIGLVTTWFERGAAVVSRQIMDVLLSKHNVFVYARGERYERGNPSWDLENVWWGKRVFRIGSGRIDRDDFEQWLREKAIDAVIFNEQRWWQPVIWAKDKGIPVGSYVDYYTPDGVEHFSAYDFLICNTRRHHEVFSWHEGAHFVAWGTDVETFKPDAHGLGLHQPFAFFHSCGMEPYRKGTDLLIEAFNAIKSNLDAKLIIHTQRRLERKHRDLKKVEVIERTVSAPGLYGLGDVYVYPSRLDGLGLTVCEALACGLPVITTNAEPMSEFVHEGLDGFLVDVERVYTRSDNYFWPITEVSRKALSGAMMRAYVDKPMVQHMKTEARQRAVAMRDWKKNGLRICAIVEEANCRRLDPLTRKALSVFDQRGVKGKLDLLFGIPLLRSPLEKAVYRYRKMRQPHLYR